jgi:hypothetical protein
MGTIEFLKWRRAGEWIIGVFFVLLAFYLRAFVYLKFTTGGLLVFLFFGLGVGLVADARSVTKKIKRISN